LATKASELDSAQAQLADQQNRLNAASELVDTQKAALATQQTKIDDLVGVRTKIIQDLSVTLTSASLKSKVDKNTGDIVLDSAVFFDTGQSTIKESGKALLNQFIPLYLSVLLRPEYNDYLGEIIIEGHTDTKGEYLMNLELSQQRALTVATYCLQMNGLSSEQRKYLRKILTAKGKSYSEPIYNADGSINMDQSRRVEFQFRLKDAEMIAEMNRILSGQ
jgi:chemotaxis protein MotB